MRKSFTLGTKLSKSGHLFEREGGLRAAGFATSITTRALLLFLRNVESPAFADPT